MNIPGLDAPSWSRVSGTDEVQEEQEEALEEAKWNEQQRNGAQSAVTFTSASGVAAPAPIACDLLILGCGMMSSAFLSAWIDPNAASAASAPSSATPAGLRELGRFTLPIPAPATVGLPADLGVGSSATKAAKAAAARPHALVLAAHPNEANAASPSTVIAFNFLRPTTQQLFDITQQLFKHVQPKQVLLLDTLHHGAYMSSERPVPCPPLLRRLQNSHLPASSSIALSAIPELEAPNLLFTLSAAALTHCEALRIPAQLLVSLESRHYLVETLQAFEEALTPLAKAGEDVQFKLSAPLRSAASSFLAADASARRRVAYRAANARLAAVYAYSAGQDSSMRETAAEVQRDHIADMFY